MARKTLGKNSGYAGGCGAMAKGGCGCGSGGGGCRGGCGPGCGCGPCESKWGAASGYAGKTCADGSVIADDLHCIAPTSKRSVFRRPSKKKVRSRGYRRAFAGTVAQPAHHPGGHVDHSYPTGGPAWGPYRAPSGPMFAPYWGGPHYNCCSPTPKTKLTPTRPTPELPPTTTQPGLPWQAVPVPHLPPPPPPPPPTNGLLLQAVPLPPPPPPPQFPQLQFIPIPQCGAGFYYDEGSRSCQPMPYIP